MASTDGLRLRWLKKHPNEEFFFVIRNRVDIFRKTDLNKERSKNTRTAGDLTLPEWLNLEQQARNIYEKTKDSSADMFEEQAWKIFRSVKYYLLGVCKYHLNLLRSYK